MFLLHCAWSTIEKCCMNKSLTQLTYHIYPLFTATAQNLRNLYIHPFCFWKFYFEFESFITLKNYFQNFRIMCFDHSLLVRGWALYPLFLYSAGTLTGQKLYRSCAWVQSLCLISPIVSRGCCFFGVLHHLWLL